MESVVKPAAERVEEAKNVWMATVRPDGRPHLVPIWFVVDAGRWYLCTAPGSVKARNLSRNPQIALALEDGSNPVVIEGEAQPASPSTNVVDKFKAKYDWDITSDGHYSVVFEVTVRRMVMGS
jgi:PPOX class probable F420-dependent enzyme